jgi:intracellular multiplication protein IcmL
MPQNSAPSPKDDPLEQIQHRYAFYQDGMKRAFLITTILGGALFLSIAGNIAQFMMKPEPRYFPVSPDGSIMEMPALKEPLLSDATLMNWVSTAAAEAYTFSYATYQRDFMQASLAFTPTGWEKFQKALVVDTKNLEAVISRKMRVYSVVTGISIIDRGIDASGRHYWWLDMPMLLTYESLSEIRTEKVMAKVLVVRRALTDHERGIGIEEYRLNRS